MEKHEDKKKERIRCEKCDSSFGYMRIKDKTWICRSCGHENKEIMF